MPGRPEDGGWGNNWRAEPQPDNFDPRRYFESMFTLSGEGTPEKPFSPTAGRELPDMLKALVGVCLNQQKLWSKIELWNGKCIFAINSDYEVFFLPSEDPQSKQHSEEVKKVIGDEAKKLFFARPRRRR